MLWWTKQRPMNSYDADLLRFGYATPLRSVDSHYDECMSAEVNRVVLSLDTDMESLVENWEPRRCDLMFRRVRLEIYDGHRKLSWLQLLWDRMERGLRTVKADETDVGMVV